MNRNGRRNRDEVRFRADYATRCQAAYIHDDDNRPGGLAAAERFVIPSDQNAAPDQGDALEHAGNDSKGGRPGPVIPDGADPLHEILVAVRLVKGDKLVAPMGRRLHRPSP